MKKTPQAGDDEISLHRDGREYLTGLRAEALEEDDHLESRELAAYVAGRLDEVARVCAEGHLECCEMCLWEARELREWVMNTTPPAGP